MIRTSVRRGRGSLGDLIETAHFTGGEMEAQKRAETPSSPYGQGSRTAILSTPPPARREALAATGTEIHRN